MQEFEIEFDLTGDKFEIDISDKVLEIRPDYIQLEVMPSNEEQIFNPGENKVYNKVTVAGDEDLKPEKLPKGLNLFGVEGIANLGDLSEYFYEDFLVYRSTAEIGSILKKLPAGIKAPSNCSSLFYSWTRPIENVDKIDFSETENMNYTFFGSKVAQDKYLDLSYAQKVTNWTSCFYSAYFGGCEIDARNVTTLQSCFYNCNSSGPIIVHNSDKVTSFYGLCRQAIMDTAPIMDTSAGTEFSQMFWGITNMKHIPEYDFGNAQTFSSIFGNVFTDCMLETVGGFKDLGKGFDPATAATANKYYFDIDRLQYARNLSLDSYKNILNKLYDIASLGMATQKIIIGSSVIKKLDPEIIAAATAKGWTVS